MISLTIIAVLLVGLVAYRLIGLRAALTASSPLRLVESLPEQTGHMVFKGPIEKNEYGFITTPLTACVDPNCPCRSMPRAFKN